MSDKNSLILVLLLKKNNNNEPNSTKTIETETTTADTPASSDSAIESESEEDVRRSSIEELAETYYNDFLEYYKEQEAEGFSQTGLEFINPIFSDPTYFPSGFDKELYYTVIDLANDGIPELFIGDTQRIYGAYSISKSDFQVWPLLELSNEFYLGGNVQCYICDDGIIKEEKFENEPSITTSFYLLKEDATELTYLESASIYENQYYGNVFGEIEAREIDEELYNEILNIYSLKEDIEWHKLSSYKAIDSAVEN
ncbi:MAG: hypothetical protein EOM34_07080 [Clostridia bacterium]|nr:hypothetical protein [Lachnospiraceae bacterium]NCC00430.1 hypothetical protein [Clostridia bacterium]NCD02629.1 hypothetical protein [Clostridia bacterium]